MNARKAAGKLAPRFRIDSSSFRFGRRQSQLPLKQGIEFSVARNVVNAVPFAYQGAPVLHE